MSASICFPIVVNEPHSGQYETSGPKFLPDAWSGQAGLVQWLTVTALSTAPQCVQCFAFGKMTSVPQTGQRAIGRTSFL